ncbi:MAG: DUF932 domain-containing protein [Gemmatimonadota bacterium]
MTAYAVDVSRGTALTAVSAQWAMRPEDEKFLSLSDLLKVTQNRAERSRTIDIDPTAIRIEPVGNADLTIDVAGTAVSPSNYAFGALASAAKAPADYLTSLPAPMAAGLLRYGLAANAPRELSAYVDDEAGQLRGLTSPRYGRVFDHQVVEALMRFAGNGNGDTRWKVPGTFVPGQWGRMYDPDVPVSKDTTTIFGGDRDIFVSLVDDRNPIEVGKTARGEPDVMFRGLIVWNSEVGARTLGVSTFYLRGVCCNRIYWGVEGYKETVLRHTSAAPDRFLSEYQPTLLSFADGATGDLFAGVMRAKEAVVARDDDDRMEFLARHRFTQTLSRKIIDVHYAEEGKPPETVWDMAQGITAAARGIAFADERFAMERRAQKILDRV